jgi:hypothetical protein
VAQRQVTGPEAACVVADAVVAIPVIKSFIRSNSSDRTPTAPTTPVILGAAN